MCHVRQLNDNCCSSSQAAPRRGPPRRALHGYRGGLPPMPLPAGAAQLLRDARHRAGHGVLKVSDEAAAIEKRYLTRDGTVGTTRPYTMYKKTGSP